MEDEKYNVENGFRQVNIAGMNESVGLSSTHPDENMEFLTDKALELFKKINGGKK